MTTNTLTEHKINLIVTEIIRGDDWYTKQNKPSSELNNLQKLCLLKTDEELGQSLLSRLRALGDTTNVDEHDFSSQSINLISSFLNSLIPNIKTAPYTTDQNIHCTFSNLLDKIIMKTLEEQKHHQDVDSIVATIITYSANFSRISRHLRYSNYLEKFDYATQKDIFKTIINAPDARYQSSKKPESDNLKNIQRDIIHLFFKNLSNKTIDLEAYKDIFNTAGKNETTLYKISKITSTSDFATLNLINELFQHLDKKVCPIAFIDLINQGKIENIYRVNYHQIFDLLFQYIEKGKMSLINELYKLTYSKNFNIFKILSFGTIKNLTPSQQNEATIILNAIANKDYSLYKTKCLRLPEPILLNEALYNSYNDKLNKKELKQLEQINNIVDNFRANILSSSEIKLEYIPQMTKPEIKTHIINNHYFVNKFLSEYKNDRKYSLENCKNFISTLFDYGVKIDREIADSLIRRIGTLNNEATAVQLLVMANAPGYEIFATRYGELKTEHHENAISSIDVEQNERC